MNPTTLALPADLTKVTEERLGRCSQTEAGIPQQSLLRWPESFKIKWRAYYFAQPVSLSHLGVAVGSRDESMNCAWVALAFPSVIVASLLIKPDGDCISADRIHGSEVLWARHDHPPDAKREPNWKRVVRSKMQRFIQPIRFSFSALDIQVHCNRNSNITIFRSGPDKYLLATIATAAQMPARAQSPLPETP